MRPLLLLAALSALASSSCFSPGDGQSPPLDSLYFPTGLALDPAPVGEASKYLYVASSDFDLQYRSSALLSYDLERVAEVVPRSCADDAQCRADEACDTKPSAENKGAPSFFCVNATDRLPCGPLGDRDAGDQIQNPGRCLAVTPLEPQDGGRSLRRDSVGIGAFATDLIVRKPGDRARLFLPVRGDASLHWIDVEDGLFECGQDDNSDHACNGAHRSGDRSDGADNDNRLRQPSEPFAIAAQDDPEFIAVTHQTTGSVSLFHGGMDDAGPTLEGILTGLPTAPVAIAAVPRPSPLLVPDELYRPAFLVGYRNAAQLDLLRVRIDPVVSQDVSGVSTSYTRYGLNDVGTVGITANAAGFDTRSIAIDASQRDADYAACSGAPDEPGCLKAATQPKVYLSNRAPPSLLIGSLMVDGGSASGSNDLPAIVDTASLTAGASRIVLGRVKVPGSTFTDEAGGYDFEQRVFIVCFDSRRVFVFDPKRRVIEAIIGTGRGPYALVIDEMRALGYVAFFTDSYLGVVSLDQRFPPNYATLVASIGTPSPPRSSK